MTMSAMDDRTVADEVIDLAEIYVNDVPHPLPEWQQRLIRQVFPRYAWDCDDHHG